MNTIPFNKLKYLTFVEIDESFDNLHLLDKDYFDGKEYTDEEAEQLWRAWLSICDDWNALDQDDKAKKRLRERFEVMELVTKIKNLTDTYNTLTVIHNNRRLLTEDTASEMEQMCYSIVIKTEKRTKIKYFEGIPKNLETINRVIKSLTSQYNIKYKRSNEQTKKEKANVYREVQAVGVHLRK